MKILHAIMLLGTILLMPEMSYSDDIAFNRLISAKSLRCSFHDGSVVTWDNGSYKYDRDKRFDNLVYDSIDLMNGKARIIGNQGAADINIVSSPSGISFLEMTGMGNITITTVFPEYQKGTLKFICTHSRHMNMGKSVIVSQYHGVCDVLE